MGETRKDIQKLVIAISNFEKIYTVNAPKAGRQSTELWLMYALNDGAPHSQKQICEEWGFPRTTLNTVTKKCEAEGYLTLSPIPGKRREMQICLTEKGIDYVNQILDVIYRAENRAMEKILERYSADFIDILEEFVECLKAAFEEENDIRKRGDISLGKSGMDTMSEM